MNPTETFPHRRDDLDGHAHCRCGVMAVHDPKLGETWGRNCPAALREALESERGRTRRYAHHLDDIRCDILDTGHPLGDDSDQELTTRRLVREVLALLAESRGREEYQRLVNAILCRPVEVAPLSHRDDSDPRVPVRSLLLVMAIKLMAAAVRANPNAKNYGAWKVSANPDAERDPEPGSPEDIEGWDIHVACVRPGGKGPAELVVEVTEERDALRARVAELEATLANERAAWVDMREDVLHGGWTRGYPIEINDVLCKIDEYMPDACTTPASEALAARSSAEGAS